MDEVGGEDQLHALRPRLRQNLAQGLERGGMWVPDGDSFALFASAAQCQLQLLADGRNFWHIIEEWNIAEAGAHAEFLCRVKRHRGRCCAAIDVKEMAVAQHRHELGHEFGIGRSLRALMIVDAGHAGNILQESLDERGDLRRLHPRAQFLRFRVFVGNGLHGQMEKNLEAATLRFVGDLHGMFMIWQNRNRQWIVQRKDSVSGRAVATQIVKNNRELGCRRRTRSAICPRRILWPDMDVNSVSTDTRL